MLTDSKFSPVKTGSLRTRVANLLKDAIFAGKLRPGEALRELHLARELQVSQATIREALVQLEQNGLVARTPNKGTVVTNLSKEDVRERLALRIVLEGVAAEEAARRMTPEQFEELARRAEAVQVALERKQSYELAQADLAFHRFIWECSGNRTLYRTLDQLTAPLFAFVSILRGAKALELRSTVNPHENVVEALRGGDPERTRQTIRQHIESSPYDKFVSSDAGDFQDFAEGLL